jgi:hypothetical protein
MLNFYYLIIVIILANLLTACNIPTNTPTLAPTSLPTPTRPITSNPTAFEDCAKTLSATTSNPTASANLAVYSGFKALTASPLLDNLFAQIVQTSGTATANSELNYFKTTAKAVSIFEFYTTQAAQLSYTRCYSQEFNIPSFGQGKLRAFGKDNSNSAEAFVLVVVENPDANLNLFFQPTLQTGDSLVVIMQSGNNSGATITPKPTPTKAAPFILPTNNNLRAINPILLVEQKLAAELDIAALPKNAKVQLDYYATATYSPEQVYSLYEAELVKAGFIRQLSQSIAVTPDLGSAKINLYFKVNGTTLKAELIGVIVIGPLSKENLAELGTTDLKTDDLLIIIMRIGL